MNTTERDIQDMVKRWRKEDEGNLDKLMGRILYHVHEAQRIGREESVKQISCKSPDDVLLVKRDRFDAYNQPIELSCKHPHIIIWVDSLNDIKFLDKKKVMEMLNG